MDTNVPDTNTFSLQDVVSVVGGDDLTEAFVNSVDGYFDPSYKGSKDNLYNFRNYTISKAFYFDSSSFLGGQTSSPVTSSMTIPATSNLLIVCIAITYGTSRTGGPPTWGGVSMTLSASNSYCEIWQLVNPDTGTQTIVIPNTGTSNIYFSLQAYHSGGTKSLYNATSDVNTSTSASGTVSIPTNTEMLVIQAVSFRSNPVNTLSFTGESDINLWRGVSGAVAGAAFQYNIYKSTTTTDTLYESILQDLQWNSIIVAFTST